MRQIEHIKSTSPNWDWAAHQHAKCLCYLALLWRSLIDLDIVPSERMFFFVFRHLPCRIPAPMKSRSTTVVLVPWNCSIIARRCVPEVNRIESLECSSLFPPVFSCSTLQLTSVRSAWNSTRSDLRREWRTLLRIRRSWRRARISARRRPCRCLSIPHSCREQLPCPSHRWVSWNGCNSSIWCWWSLNISPMLRIRSISFSIRSAEWNFVAN